MLRLAVLGLSFMALSMVALLAPARAFARELPAVGVEVVDCADLHPTVLGRAVALELKVRLVSDEEPGLAARVTVRCVGDRLQIDVDDRITGKHSDRQLDASALPAPARARLVALAVAELVSASWVEAVLFPEPSVRSRSASAPPKLVASVAATFAPRSERSAGPLRLVALAACAGAFGETGPLCGGGLRTGGDHLRGLSWTTDVFVLHGSRGTAIGAVDLDLAAFGARIGYGARLGRVTLRIEAGARGGAAHFAGIGNLGVQSSSFWKPFGGPVGELDLSIVLSRWLLLESSLEVGWMARPARARIETANGQVNAVALDGAFVMGSVGIGLRPQR